MDNTHAQRLVHALDNIARRLQELKDLESARMAEMKRQTVALREIHEQIRSK